MSPSARAWTVVVPVRDPATGKSRLGLGPALAEAMAFDTVTAVAGCPEVDRVVVVTDEVAWTSGLPAEITVQDSPGLAAALACGLRACGPEAVALLLGDLPALRPDELSAALRRARTRALGLVADHTGTGTTLTTALRRDDHTPRFGPGSAEAHRTAGYVDLAVPAASGLRLDVDTADDLRQALALGVGPRTIASVPPAPGRKP